ncbi:hypothetical protein [Paraburkholderia sp. RAU2J]|uniref:hypothetical protein n=1 Tax=Paraburkholderia sp. RAU2J TaxID=1938810 RepID=UPI001A7E33A9|nr:hypothetical protein [Paraburkholderia sp. RAU2J]
MANLPKWMQTKIGDMKGAARRVQDAPDVLKALLAARDGDLPEAKALAERVLGNKELMAEFEKLLTAHGIEIPTASAAKAAPTAGGNGLSAARNEVAGSEEERDEINKRIAKEEGLAGIDAAAAEPTTGNSLRAARIEINKRIAKEKGLAGFDAGRPILTAEDAARVAAARAKLSRLRTAEAIGDAGDIVRAKFGMEERPATADDLFALGREGESKFTPRG